MEDALSGAFAAIEAATFRRAEKDFLHKHAVTVALTHVLDGGNAMTIASPPGPSTTCAARDAILHRASNLLGAKIGVADLQIELRDRGRGDLSRDLEALNRARRVEAHPVFHMELCQRICQTLETGDGDDTGPAPC